MQLLRAPGLDLGQAGDQLVATVLEVAEAEQTGGVRGVGAQVGPQTAAGAGLEVVDDGHGELLLQPGDLSAQRPSGGVLVAVQASARDGRGRRGEPGWDVACDERVGPLVQRLESFDPSHPHLPRVDCSPSTVAPHVLRVDRDPTPYVTTVRRGPPSDARRPGSGRRAARRGPRGVAAPRRGAGVRRSAAGCGTCSGPPARPARGRRGPAARRARRAACCR